MTSNASDRFSHPTSGEDHQNLLAAALAGDRVAFASLTEPYRKELLSHCYRMLGSLEDAEDQVQETFLRAWRRLHTYQSKGSLRAWMYKIATNACLDVLAKRPKRSLPVELYPPADPSTSPGLPMNEPVWIQPYPDELLAPVESGPEARYESRESISFAFMIALQDLPARQRCALILGDVLGWPAAEIAEVLGITVSAVNSLLHRARSILKKRYPRKDAVKPYLTEERQKQLLERYLHAWEIADIDGIVSMLTEEANFPMPPLTSWYQGRAAIRAFILKTSLAGEASGRWRLLPIRANGLPGFAFYLREENTGEYLPFALQVLSFANELLSDVTTFGYPELFPAFNLPASLAG
jgi:RNA polymerase sigma-70 factor, ECF subfamily